MRIGVPRPRRFSRQLRNFVKNSGGYNGRDAFIHKLSHAANYFRFYVPKLMWDEHRAEAFLYLDTDTLFLREGALPTLFAQRAEPPLIVRAGAQDRTHCSVGHIVPTWRSYEGLEQHRRGRRARRRGGRGTRPCARGSSPGLGGDVLREASGL